jgi:hypothetical protein
MVLDPELKEYLPFTKFCVIYYTKIPYVKYYCPSPTFEVVRVR